METAKMNNDNIYSLWDILDDKSLRIFMSTCQMYPIGHKIIVKVPRLSEKTESGFVLPKEFIESEQDSTTFGEIVGLSRNSFDDLEKEDRPPIGLKVCFKKYSGAVPQKDLNEHFEYRVIGDSDVYCWIGEDKYKKIIKKKRFI